MRLNGKLLSVDCSGDCKGFKRDIKRGYVLTHDAQDLVSNLASVEHSTLDKSVAYWCGYYLARVEFAQELVHDASDTGNFVALRDLNKTLEREMRDARVGIRLDIKAGA
jgi:hypothetical protein